MIIETDEVVLMNDDEDYAAMMIGGIWTSFKASIPEPQATILTKGYNLIFLSDPDTLVQNQITEILVDENQDTPVQKLSVFTLITNTLLDVLKDLGFIINADEVSINRLEELCNIVSFFYDLHEYEDVIGLGDLLDSQDIPPVNRFLLAMGKYLGENVSLEEYELLLEDISEVTLSTLRAGLKGLDPSEEMPEVLVKRIRDNHALMEDTLAYRHILHNGRVGGSVEAFLSFFKDQLDPLLETNATADQIRFAKEITAIYLVSEINSDRLKDELYRYLQPLITDHFAVIGLDALLNRLVLNHDQA